MDGLSPLFEYGCPACQATTERLEFGHVDHIVEPPKCEKCGIEMKKVISVSSFRLFGDGFYKPSSRT